MALREEASSVQQALGLLRFIVVTTISTAFLSLVLPFRALARKSAGADVPVSKRTSVSFYQGTVWHERRVPVHHRFSYNVRYALVCLDSPPFWFNASARHHLTASQARDISETKGPVYLLTVPTSVGYEQNPLSVYYCFNEDDICLETCIAEVTNSPWAERVTFLFDPNGDFVAKSLHVSPFMDMLGTWRMKACIPDKKLGINITVEHPEHGNFFTASLNVKRVDHPRISPEWFFWLMPHKTALAIYWHAFLLWWKGVRIYGHPMYSGGNAYRVCAIQRDQEIRKGKSIVASAVKQNRCYKWYEPQS